MQRTLDDNINVLKNLEKDARKLESENSKLQSVLIVAEKDYSNVFKDLFSLWSRQRLNNSLFSTQTKNLNT